MLVGSNSGEQREATAKAGHDATETLTATAATAPPTNAPFSPNAPAGASLAPTQPADNGDALSPIERFVKGHIVGVGRLSSGLLGIAIVGMLLSLAWLFSYEKVILVSAHTEIAEFSVLDGDALDWRLPPGAVANCNERHGPAEPLADGAMLKVRNRVQVRITAKSQESVGSFWELNFSNANPVEKKSPPGLYEVGPGGIGIRRKFVLPQTFCVKTALLVQDLGLPVRGVLTIGVADNPTGPILTDGEVLLIESAWMRRWWSIFDYQIENERTALELGDQVTLPSVKNETSGFARLGRADHEELPRMIIRAATTSDSAKIQRPGREVRRLHANVIRRVVADPWLAMLISAAAFCGGIGWAAIGFLPNLRERRS